MGTITTRKTKQGITRYRAEIRINKEGYPKFSESKTFSKKSLAENWVKKREAELEINPELLHKRNIKSMRLQDAINRYIKEVGNNFGKSWIAGLETIAKMPFAMKYIDKLNRDDFANFADCRLNGRYNSFQPIKPQTLMHDFISIRAVLNYAENVWGIDVRLDEFEKSVRGLRNSRQVTSSDKRTRLPTNEELQALTTFFYKKFISRDTAIPLHLVIWFAIYTARRQEEICRLALSDYRDGWWLVRDIKNPTGSQGKHKQFKVVDEAKMIIPLLLDDELREVQRRQLSKYNNELLLPCQPKSISSRFTETCKILGIDDLCFHDLRHEACTRLAEQGLTIPQIQQISCHESWSSLQRYVNMKPRKSVLKFDEAMRSAKLAIHG